MRKALPIYVLMLLLLSACTSETILKNIDIDEKDRNAINDIDIKVFSLLKMGDYDQITDYLSSAARQTLRDSMKIKLSAFQQRLENKSFSIINEYYVERLLPGAKIHLSDSGVKYPYTIDLKAPTTKTYISMLDVGDKYHSTMLMYVYGNYLGKWKINMLHINNYSINGMNAPALYNEARKLRNDSDLADAKLYMDYCRICWAPYEGVFGYDCEDEMKDFYLKISDEVKQRYPLPYKLTDVPTGPEIEEVTSTLNEGGVMPLIEYTTRIDLHDAVALRKENEAIQRSVKKLFTGMYAYNDYILLRAHHNTTHSIDTGRYYQFVYKKAANRETD